MLDVIFIDTQFCEDLCCWATRRQCPLLSTKIHSFWNGTGRNGNGTGQARDRHERARKLPDRLTGTTGREMGIEQIVVRDTVSCKETNRWMLYDAHGAARMAQKLFVL